MCSHSSARCEADDEIGIEQLDLGLLEAAAQAARHQTAGVHDHPLEAQTPRPIQHAPRADHGAEEIGCRRSDTHEVERHHLGLGQTFQPAGDATEPDRRRRSDLRLPQIRIHHPHGNPRAARAPASLVTSVVLPVSLAPMTIVTAAPGDSPQHLVQRRGRRARESSPAQ